MRTPQGRGTLSWALWDAAPQGRGPLVWDSFPGPQGPDQSFLAQEGWGALPRAAACSPGHFGMQRHREGGLGPGTPTLGLQGPDQTFLVQKGRRGLSKAVEPCPGYFGMQGPGEGGSGLGTPSPAPQGPQSELLGPGRLGRPPQGLWTSSRALWDAAPRGRLPQAVDYHPGPSGAR